MTSNQRTNCGFCGKIIAKKEQPFQFPAKCDLCDKKHFVHIKCATTLVLESQGVKTETVFGNVEAETFKNTKTTLWCIDCKSTNCFFCDTEHKTTNNTMKLLCNVCKKKWCRILEYKGSQTKKKRKSQPCREATSLMELQKSAICNNCKQNPSTGEEAQQTKSKNASPTVIEESEMPSNDKETTTPSTTGLRRFYNPQNENYLMPMTLEFHEYLSDTITTNLHFGCGDQTSEEDFFSSMIDAKQFFDSRVVFFPNENCNIFSPVNLNNCYDSVIIPEKLDEGIKLFNLSYKDIKTIYDKTWLNGDGISFILRALNHVSIGGGFSGSDINAPIPNVIFGDYSVNNFLYFKNIPDIWSYLEASSKSKGRKVLNNEGKAQCIEAMKKWYTSSKQGYLGRILDYYQSKNQRIISFSNVVNVNENHWVYINVVLQKILNDSSTPPDESGPYVETIDNLNKEDDITETAHMRMCYAKFFGLYYKENYVKEPLNDQDFDGHDIVNDMMQSNIDTESTKDNYGSLLPHYVKEPKFQQPDSDNCGVIALFHCISRMKMDNTYEDRMKELCDDNEHAIQAEFERKRTQLLSIIGAVWERLHGQRYKKYEDQLVLSLDHRRSKVVTSEDVRRWKKCHQLFEKGVQEYKYNDRKGPTANKFFQSNRKISQLHQMITIASSDIASDGSSTESDESEIDKSDSYQDDSPHEPEKKKQRKSQRLSKSTSNTKNDVSDNDSKSIPEPSQSTASQSKQKVQGTRSKKIVSPEDSTASLRVCVLRDQKSSTTRSSNIIDLSELIVSTSIEKIDKTTATMNDTMKPYETANMLSTLFKESYLPKSTANKESKQFTEYVKLVMSNYITLFVMDVVTDEDTATQKYDVVAAVVVEPNVVLDTDHIDHALIHLFAIKSGFERKPHPKVLLFQVSKHLALGSKPVAFVSRWKNREHLVRSTAMTDEDTSPVTPTSIFKELCFTASDNKYLDELIEPEKPEEATSQYMFGNAEIMKKMFYVHLDTQAS